MNGCRTALLALTMSAFALTSGSARADGRNPGSLLLFAEFDNREGCATVLTVTNTNSTQNGGATRLEIVYRNGETGDFQCLESNDQNQVLTPNDTLTWLTDAPGIGTSFEVGYVYVIAIRPVGNDEGNGVDAFIPQSFNYLIGNSLVIDGITTFQFSTNPFSFKSPLPEGAWTDLEPNGGDGHHDLDGMEYEEGPDRILIPRFLGQTASRKSRLVLIGLTGGLQFTNIVDFLVYNDNEQIYSAQYSFRCWTKVKLKDINALFTHDFLDNYTDQDPAEILGEEDVEAGWFELDGNVAYSTNTAFGDPLILAVLSERAGDQGGSDLPFTVGTQDNGSLLPEGNNGD